MTGRNGLLVVAVLMMFGWGCAGGGGEEEGTECASVCTGKCRTVEGCDCGVCDPGGSADAVEETGTDPCAGVCDGVACGELAGCPCGECGGGFTCTAGACVELDPCLEVCEGKKCSPAGEECDCGTCLANAQCEEGVCVCTPDCAGKECGSDGCTGICDECDGGWECGSDFMCHDPSACEFTFAPAQKVNYMAIGIGGHAGEALDVDDDPDTCSPPEDCEGGYNNQLSGLLEQLEAFVDPEAEIAKALDEGQILLLAETVGYTDNGSQFTINMYLGDAAEDKDVCDWQVDKCSYLAKPDSIDLATCAPLIAFDNATVNDGKLHAGGKESLFTIAIPIAEGAIFQVTANMAQMVGDMVADGEDLRIENGIIGGAVRKDKMLEGVDLMPDSVMLEMPVSKEMLKQLLLMFVTEDIDTDDDGDLAAASIGVKYATIPGSITGVSFETE